MIYTRKNQGVCSACTKVTVENGILTHVEIDEGCDGNISGMIALAKGRPAKEVAALLKGTTCGRKKTSCPDQLARCIEEALSKDEP